MHNFLNYIHRI